MAPYREDVVHRSEALEIRWERPDPELPRVLILEHDPGEAGLPEQRRLPEGYGLEGIGGVLGLLGLGAFVAHRVGRTVEPLETRVRFGPQVLTFQRPGDARKWLTPAITDFGMGQDSPEWRTIFVEQSGGRELLMDGLSRDDAVRAVEALREALRVFAHEA